MLGGGGDGDVEAEGPELADVGAVTCVYDMFYSCCWWTIERIVVSCALAAAGWSAPMPAAALTAVARTRRRLPREWRGRGLVMISRSVVSLCLASATGALIT